MKLLFWLNVVNLIKRSVLDLQMVGEKTQTKNF